MSPIWMIPVIVLPLGGIAVALAAKQAAEAVRDLVREADRLGEVAVAVVGTFEEVGRTGAILRSRPQQ